MNHLTRRNIIYSNDNLVMTGVIITNDKINGRRPGVLLAPNMMGVTESNIAQAYKVAEQGYTVLVADLYGFLPTTADVAMVEMNAIKDTSIERERMQAALNTLASEPDVDEFKLAILGFCYGGHCALELIRSGANVSLVFCVHGTLSTLHPAEEQKLKNKKIIVLNGAKDPFVSSNMVAEFCREMSEAAAEFTFVNYASAVHAFTYPKADVVGKMEYNEAVCNQAFQIIFDEMRHIFNWHDIENI